MNRAFRTIIDHGAPPHLRPTPFAFGGNMTITRELYDVVPFDPAITRGEDIDYLINARLAGHRFVLDNRLAVTHLPPPHSHPDWLQLRQDAVRFAYQRDKIRAASLAPTDLDPYPGPYLGAELSQKLQETCVLLADEYRAAGDWPSARETDRLGAEVANLCFPEAWQTYLAYQARWQQLMQRLDQDTDLADHVFAPSR